MNNSDSHLSNWVDRYLLRYGPGTILGACIVAYGYSTRRDLGITTSLRLEKGELAAIFAAGGFLLCYVSSAPILVSHVSRVLYIPESAKRVSYAASAGTLLLMAAFSVSYILQGIEPIMAIIGGAAWSIWFMAMVFGIYANFRRKSIFDFYKQLCKRRSTDTIGFVESYRTMREHGNAFLILLYEVLFSGCCVALIRLWKVQGADELFACILFLTGMWITPSAIVWTIASKLEADFVDSDAG